MRIFDVTWRRERALRKRILLCFRAAIDSFVIHRMRETASWDSCLREMEYPGDERESIVASASSDTAPEIELRPLGEDVLSAAIPAFFIGRNMAGLWVAREARGRTGGTFLFKRSALAFARAQAGKSGCAFIFPSGRFELDLEARAIHSPNRCRA